MPGDRGDHSRMKAIRRKLVHDQGGRCAYCGCHMTEADGVSPRSATLYHCVPVCMGGGNRIDNLVACCFTCNQAKADDLPGHGFARPKKRKKQKRAKVAADAQIQADRAARKAHERARLGTAARQ